MKVSELIEKLMEMPQDAIVWSFVDDESAKANVVYCVSNKVYVGLEHKRASS